MQPMYRQKIDEKYKKKIEFVVRLVWMGIISQRTRILVQFAENLARMRWTRTNGARHAHSARDRWGNLSSAVPTVERRCPIAYLRSSRKGLINQLINYFFANKKGRHIEKTNFAQCSNCTFPGCFSEFNKYKMGCGGHGWVGAMGTNCLNAQSID